MAEIGSRSRLRSAIQSLLLLGASTVVMLLLAEGAVRLIIPQFLRPVFRERVDGAFVLRADLHARIYAPGEFDTRVNTSSQRFRGTAQYQPIPPAGTYRIAVLGDSFAFGTGANDDESYPRLLEAELAGGSGRPRVEVLNAGIPNSGTGDQAIWFNRWVKDFHPDLVVLSVYGGNDVPDEIHDSKFALAADGSAAPLDLDQLEKNGGLEAWLQTWVLRIPGYNYLTQHSQLLYAVRAMITGLFSRNDAGRLEQDTAVAIAIDKIAAEVAWLRQRVEASGAKFAVVFIPSRDALLDRTGNADVLAERRLDERLTRETTRGGIPFLDLTPLLKPKMMADPGALYFAHDDHMRPEGYRIVAEETARFLSVGGQTGGL